MKLREVFLSYRLIFQFMYMPFQKQYWNWSYQRFIAAPAVFKIFAVFSVVVSIFAIVEIFLPRSVHEAIIPITGWVGLFFYCSTLGNIFAILFARGFTGLNRLRRLRSVIRILLIMIGIGFFYLYLRLRPDYSDYGNPYLIISMWRPVWTIILPLFWITVLNTKRVKEFCSLPHG